MRIGKDREGKGGGGKGGRGEGKGGGGEGEERERGERGERGERKRVRVPVICGLLQQSVQSCLERQHQWRAHTSARSAPPYHVPTPRGVETLSPKPWPVVSGNAPYGAPNILDKQGIERMRPGENGFADHSCIPLDVHQTRP